jgi:predicted RNA-binding protein YlqC (UPF0109 family)
MENMEQDQQFVEYVVKGLVDHPEEVRTERKVDEMGVLITLFVDQQDFGQVIGRNGQTAKALRTLLRIVGAKNRSRVNLKIYEPEREDGGRDHGTPRSEQPSESQERPETVDPLDTMDL